jgi:hypothetical protein
MIKTTRTGSAKASLLPVSRWRAQDKCLFSGRQWHYYNVLLPVGILGVITGNTSRTADLGLAGVGVVNSEALTTQQPGQTSPGSRLPSAKITQVREFTPAGWARADGYASRVGFMAA